MSEPYDDALRLQLRRERAETAAAYERARVAECVCDLCGASIGYTGKTERLEQGNQGPPLRYPREVSGGVFK